MMNAIAGILYLILLWW